MKTLVLILLSLVIVQPVAADVAFAGVLVSGGTTHVILIDPASGRSSGWIQVGDSFERYTVVRYDAASERLVVSLAGKEQPLPLVGPGSAISQQRTFAIGSKSYEVYADSQIKDGDSIVFRGHVTAISASGHFSCDELRVDLKSEVMLLLGSVRIQRGKSLIWGQRVRIVKQPNKAPEPTP